MSYNAVEIIHSVILLNIVVNYWKKYLFLKKIDICLNFSVLFQSHINIKNIYNKEISILWGFQKSKKL